MKLENEKNIHSLSITLVLTLFFIWGSACDDSAAQTSRTFENNLLRHFSGHLRLFKIKSCDTGNYLFEK